tara:strand:- start:1149 stop:6116 length:4968 start_codon:yes stop_codon:yes gene_type:complete
MAKYRYTKKYTGASKQYAEGSSVSGGNMRGRFDQEKKEVTGPDRNFGNFVGDTGKWMINQALTPIETISGRNFYDPEFAYSEMNELDAVTSGISSAATDIVGTYFAGPFYTGGKKLVQAGVNKVDADGSWDNTNAQVARQGGPVHKYQDASTVLNAAGGMNGNNMFSMMGANPALSNGTDASGLMNSFKGTPYTSDANTGLAYGAKGNLSLGLSVENKARELGVFQGGDGQNFGGDIMSLFSGAGKQGAGNASGMGIGGYMSLATEADPNTLAIQGTDAGRNTRNWSGVGNFASNLTSNTVQETKAKEIAQVDVQNALTAENEDSDMLRYSSEGAGNRGVVEQGNPMNNAHTLQALGTQNVESGWADKTGQAISQAGALASNFVGGDVGGASGGGGIFGGGGSNFDLMKNFDINNIGSSFGMNAPGSVRNGGLIQHKMGSNVKKDSTPAGVDWDGQTLNVPENYQGYFEIPGESHENGGTLMHTPAEGQGNTTIEAELGEGAEVKDGETYIYSKTTKHPKTGQTFKVRKDKREKESLSIDKLLADENIANDTYKINALNRRKTTLLVEEEADRSIQDSIKEKNELRDQLKVEELLASGKNITSTGSYRHGGKTRKMNLGQRNILEEMISGGMVEEYQEAGPVEKEKAKKEITKGEIPFAEEIDGDGVTVYKIHNEVVSKEEYNKEIEIFNSDPENYVNIPYKRGDIEVGTETTQSPINTPINLQGNPDGIENIEFPSISAPRPNPMERVPQLPIQDIKLPTVEDLELQQAGPFDSEAADERRKGNEAAKLKAAQDYDVDIEDLIYDEQGNIVPEVGSKSKSNGDTWSGDGWNDDAPEVAQIKAEQRQQDIINNRNKSLTPPPSTPLDPNNNIPDPIANIDYDGDGVPDNGPVRAAESPTGPGVSSNSTEGVTPQGPRGGAARRSEIADLQANTVTPTVVTAGGEGGEGTEGDGTEGEVVPATNTTPVDTTPANEVVVDNNTVVDNTVPPVNGGDGNGNGNRRSSSSSSQTFSQNNINPYDWLGMAGLSYGALAGHANTRENREETPPNINFMEDTYKKPIHRLNQNTEIIEAANMNTDRNLREDLNTQLQRIRTSGNSFQNVDARSQNAYNTYASNTIDADVKYGMMNLGLQKNIADLEGKDRKLFLDGEGIRDTNDRKDTDNYYTQRGTDIQNTAKNMMEMARNGNNSAMELLKSNSIDGLTNGDTPIQYGPDGQPITNNTTNNTTNNGGRCPGGICPGTHGDGSECPGAGCTHPEHNTDNNTDPINNNNEIPGDNTAGTNNYYNLSNGSEFSTNFSGNYNPGEAGHFQEFARGMNLDLGEFGATGTEWEGVDNNIGKFTTAGWDISSNAYKDYLTREGTLGNLTGISEAADKGGTKLPFRRDLSDQAGTYSKNSTYAKFDNPELYYNSLNPAQQQLLKDNEPDVFGGYRRGGFAQMSRGGGAQPRKYQDADKVVHEGGLSENVKENYNSIFGAEFDFSSKETQDLLASMNMNSSDTLIGATDWSDRGKVLANTNVVNRDNHNLPYGFGLASDMKGVIADDLNLYNETESTDGDKTKTTRTISQDQYSKAGSFMDFYAPNYTNENNYSFPYTQRTSKDDPSYHNSEFIKMKKKAQRYGGQANHMRDSILTSRTKNSKVSDDRMKDFRNFMQNRK